MSTARPKKRSLTLRGHRTSVSLEDAFWRALCRFAMADGLSVNEFAARIDEARAPGTGLASAIRVHLLERALNGA
jgi:predicted DNA-binding ribbon-helix-helix protein